MTAAVTDREIRSNVNGQVPRLEGAPVSTRARARIPVTDSSGKIRCGVAAVRGVFASWWVWTAQPAALRDSWTASAVDVRRVPFRNTALHWVWRVSNWTDRLAMFLFLLAAPTALTGPLRWCAQRPTRRGGLYLLVATTAVAFYLTGKG